MLSIKKNPCTRRSLGLFFVHVTALVLFLIFAVWNLVLGIDVLNGDNAMNTDECYFWTVGQMMAILAILCFISIGIHALGLVAAFATSLYVHFSKTAREDDKKIMEAAGSTISCIFNIPAIFVAVAAFLVYLILNARAWPCENMAVHYGEWQGIKAMLIASYPLLSVFGVVLLILTGISCVYCFSGEKDDKK